MALPLVPRIGSLPLILPLSFLDGSATGLLSNLTLDPLGWLLPFIPLSLSLFFLNLDPLTLTQPLLTCSLVLLSGSSHPIPSPSLLELPNPLASLGP